MATNEADAVMLPDPPPYEQHHIVSITELPEGISPFADKYHTLVLMTDRQMFCSCQPEPIDRGPKFNLNLKTVPAGQLPNGATYDPRYDTQLAIYAQQDANAREIEAGADPLDVLNGEK